MNKYKGINSLSKNMEEQYKINESNGYAHLMKMIGMGDFSSAKTEESFIICKGNKRLYITFDTSITYHTYSDPGKITGKNIEFESTFLLLKKDEEEIIEFIKNGLKCIKNKYNKRLIEQVGLDPDDHESIREKIEIFLDFDV